MACIICNKEKQLRQGACFECAEAESIIEDGTDMYDKPLDFEMGGSESLKKLKYLYQKGWRFTGKKQDS